MATSKVTLSPEFETEVLKYLCQTKHAKIWLPQMTDQNFDNPDNQIVFQLLKDFSAKYNSIATFNEMMEYFEIQSAKQNLKQDVINVIKRAIRISYKPLGGNVEFVQEQIVTFLKRKMMKILIQKNADKIRDGDNEFFDYLNKETEKIVRIGDIDMEAPEDTLVFEDYNARVKKNLPVFPTYIHGLNRFTAVGGFRCPELIIFLAGPKSFKTGLMLNIAVDYAQSGVPVYYIDCENGEDAIDDRIHQAMLKCTYGEYKKGVYKKELKSINARSKSFGGEIAYGYYPANTCTVNDVVNRLDLLKEERGFIPKIVFWDYPDLFLPIDKSIKEKRLISQAVYHDIIKFNKKRSTCSFGVSQTNRVAFDKKFISAKDFGEDFGKAANCHASFALCRTAEEKAEGFGRLEPVVQRMGVSAGKGRSVLLKIEEDRMLVEEQSYSDAVEKAQKRIQAGDDD